MVGGGPADDLVVEADRRVRSVVINSYQMKVGHRFSPSGLVAGVEHELEAAEDHPLHVERHVGDRLHLADRPSLGHALVARLACDGQTIQEKTMFSPSSAATAR